MGAYVVREDMRRRLADQAYYRQIMIRDDMRRRLAAQAYHRQMLALPQLNTRHFDNAYVVEDDMDAGRVWNQTPPSMADVDGLDEFGCIPPGQDQGLGFFAIAAPIIGAAIQAGASVGGAMIAADAQKYAVRQQTKADLQIALARAHSELEQTKATTSAQVEIAKETTKQRTVEVEASTQQTAAVTSNLVPVVGILGAGAIVAWIMLKD